MRSCDSSLSSISYVTVKQLNVSSCNSANKDVYNVVWGFIKKTGIKLIQVLTEVQAGTFLVIINSLKHPFDHYYYVKKYQKHGGNIWHKVDCSPARIREGRRTFKRQNQGVI